MFTESPCPCAEESTSASQREQPLPAPPLSSFGQDLSSGDRQSERVPLKRTTPQLLRLYTLWCQPWCIAQRQRPGGFRLDSQGFVFASFLPSHLSLGITQCIRIHQNKWIAISPQSESHLELLRNALPRKVSQTCLWIRFSLGQGPGNLIFQKFPPMIPMSREVWSHKSHFILLSFISSYQQSLQTATQAPSQCSFQCTPCPYGSEYTAFRRLMIISQRFLICGGKRRCFIDKQQM